MSFDPSKNSVMLEFNTASGKMPSLQEAQRQFALTDGDVDQSFGVIPLCGMAGDTYIIVVEETAAQKIENAKMPGFIGSWPNTKFDFFNPL